jgi:MATE family multidrug resistance protein
VTVRDILRLGIPISLTYGSEAGITSVATLIMGSFGPIALAAHNVVNQLAYIVYQINIGLSHGSSILVSRALGQGNRTEAGQIARTALTLGVVAMSLAGLVYLTVPTWVLRLFLDLHADPTVESLTKTLLFFGVAQQFLKGTQNISVGLLRGLGNTKSGFRITLIGYWVVGTPATLLFGYVLGLHGPGVWIGLCTGFGATAILLLRRFRKDLSLGESASAPGIRTAAESDPRVLGTVAEPKGHDAESCSGSLPAASASRARCQEMRISCSASVRFAQVAPSTLLPGSSALYTSKKCWISSL